MNRSFYFMPVNMRALADSLGREVEGSAVRRSVDDTALRKEMTRLCMLSDEQAREEAYVLGMSQLLDVADYIATNRFALAIDSLVTILKTRKNTRLFKRLFQLWKRYYTVVALCDVIAAYYGEYDVLDAVAETRITMAIWDMWTHDRENCAINMARYLYAEGKNLEALKEYGINASDTVYQGVRGAWLLICPQEDYRQFDPQKVLERVKVFTQKQQHLFLEHFLVPWPNDTDVLRKYEKVCTWFTHEYSIDNGKTFSFWKDATEDEHSAFKRWTNLLSIERLFGKDERSNFWYHFIGDLENVSSVRDSDGDYRIAMRFKSFTVIEFTERGFAAQIVTDSHYKQYLSRYFEGREEATHEHVRRAITSNYIARDRIVHRGSWQAEAQRMVERLIWEEKRYGN